ncbi:MAG: hypothetical protein CVU56_10835 [Deltaproteobacteria bacterium HGW-Deltaproteobacteria-14]|jgi:hypothetical protein|nr:MAG: hypothetical protein CVU56_10835 [Deltaproteobacteria bacterium HGW-Deltaproteobacteria-14]
MDTFKETTTVSAPLDGFVAISEARDYDDGIRYRSTLYVQVGDLAAVADALERYAAARANESVTLADGTLSVFGMEPSPMVNLELDRAGDLEHGGYETLDLDPSAVAGLVAALRAAAQ